MKKEKNRSGVAHRVVPQLRGHGAVIALDAELAILPTDTFGVDHPTAGFVRDAAGGWVAGVNADPAGCNLKKNKKKQEKKTCVHARWLLVDLLHPVHGAIREQLKVRQGPAEPC